MKNNINYRAVWMSVWLSLCFLPFGMADLAEKEKRELKQQHQAYQEFSEEELDESLSLEEALRYGLSSHAGLRAAFYQWKAAFHKVRQSQSLEDPEFAFRTFLNKTEEDEKMFSVSQALPFPGKLYLQGKEETAAARQMYAEYQKAKLSYFYELKDAYFEYWFLHKNTLVVQAHKDLLKNIESVAQSKFKAGLVSNQDLLKAQVELGRLENDLLTFQDYRNPIVFRINSVLNRDWKKPIGWPDEIGHQIQELSEDLIFEKFYESNPDLKKAAQRTEETKRKVALARLDYLPDTVLSLDYVNMQGRQNDGVALMVKVQVPLWYGRQKSQLEEARSLKVSAEAEIKQIENDLVAEIRMIYFKLKNAERQIQLFRDALVPKAEQSLKASETAYSGGRVDFLNLIDSQRTLLDFQLSYYKAIRDYEQRLAELEMMVGESLRGQHDGK